MTIAKKTDAKGRIALGLAYANLTLLLEKQRGGVLLKRAAIVPEMEARTHKNKPAIASGRKDAGSHSKPTQALESLDNPTEKIKRMRGFLKGIDTTVHRDKDRV